MKSLDLIKLLKFHENTNQETRFLEKTTNKHFNIFFSLMVPPLGWGPAGGDKVLFFPRILNGGLPCVHKLSR